MRERRDNIPGKAASEKRGPGDYGRAAGESSVERSASSKTKKRHRCLYVRCVFGGCLSAVVSVLMLWVVEKKLICCCCRRCCCLIKGFI